jgi:ribosomal protein S8
MQVLEVSGPPDPQLANQSENRLKHPSKFSWGRTLILRLKYVEIGPERKFFIGGLQRVSKTSRSEYIKVRNMPKLLGGVEPWRRGANGFS